VFVVYRLLEGDHGVSLSLRPSVGLRSLHAPVNEASAPSHEPVVMGDRFELALGPGLPRRGS